MIEMLMQPVNLAVFATALSVALIAYLVAAPRPVRVPIDRRRPGLEPTRPVLERMAAGATAVIERAIRRRGVPAGASLFELAGLKMRRQDIVFLIGIGSLVGGAAGLMLGSLRLALFFAGLSPALVRVWLGLKINRRQKQFSEQLDDSLSLMASNLRAGHSLAQALASVAGESESPTAEEFTRVVNETRVGRPLVDSLNDTAARMESEDFRWAAQAIGINQEVGGNLAEILDQVATTIRQRNEIRRLVATLSAEGRLSAIILMALPFVVTGFLLISNPSYLAPFTEGIIGPSLIVLGVVMLIIGGIWLGKTVTIKF